MQIVEADVLTPSHRQNFLVGVPEGVRVVHRPRFGRGEHIRIFWMLLVLQDQQIHRLLWDGDGTDGVCYLLPECVFPTSFCMILQTLSPVSFF